MTQKVLVADDSIASQRLFEMVLKREGYDVITIGSGAQVLDTVDEKHPDIALIDAVMPESDGYQMCQTLKEKQLPVILLAGKHEDIDREKGINAVGANAILNKPASSTEIVSKVKELLEAVAISPMTEVPVQEAGVIQEPPFVQEEYAFDEESEEADRVVESEILEEGVTEYELGEEEEIEEIHEESSIEEPEGTFLLEEESAPVVEEVPESEEEPAPVVEEVPESEEEPAPVVEEVAPQVSPVVGQESGEALQFSDEKLDMIANEIAQRLAKKFVPVLMQEIGNYFMQFPAVNTIVEQTSKQLVKEMMPEIREKL